MNFTGPPPKLLQWTADETALLHAIINEGRHLEPGDFPKFPGRTPDAVRRKVMKLRKRAGVASPPQAHRGGRPCGTDWSRVSHDKRPVSLGDDYERRKAMEGSAKLLRWQLATGQHFLSDGHARALMINIGILPCPAEPQPECPPVMVHPAIRSRYL